MPAVTDEPTSTRLSPLLAVSVRSLWKCRSLVLAATVVIEAVFAIPGMGSLIVRGALQRDFPIVQGVVFAMVIVVIAVNLIADLLCAAVDPRIEQ